MEHTKMLTSIVFLDNQPIEIGINADKKFVAKFSEKNIVEIKEENIVYVLRLLELDYSFFVKQIEKMKNEIHGSERDDDFPFLFLVRAALKSSRDYWIELAIPWIEGLGKDIFKDDIQEVARNKNISQSLRHRLLKL